ncbi:MAG TPA: thiol reductant ABC exporter subunit CydD [Solirubrobacteraceae bacterium]|nr:thiol reductant ABC exporter subunit CydD [Solirubrobacteraceae bacterium]
MRRRRGAAAARSDRRLFAESRAARTQFLLAAGLGIATAAAIVAQAALLAHVIAAAAVAHRTLAQLSGAIAALSAVIAARAVLAGAFETSGRIGATRVMSELRARLAEQLLVRSPLPRAGDRTGELAAAAVQGVDSLEAYFAGYLPQLVLAAAVPLAIVAWVLPLDPIADAVLALTIPILIVFMVLVGIGAQAKARSRWSALALLSGHFLEVVRGLPTLRAYRRETAQAGAIERVAERYRAETMGTLRVAFLSALVLELCAMVGTALVAATIGIQLDGGHLTLQAGLTVLLLAPELYAPLRAVGQQFHASADGIAAAERIFAVLDAAPALVPRRRVRRAVPDPARAPVRLDAVTFAYPDRAEEVLRDLTLELAPGVTTALTGPSGAGKSTVAALVLRLADPSRGRVTCGGVDLRELAPAAWRSQLAWVPQRARLFAGTLAENVALGEPDASRSRIAAAAEAAGLDRLIGELPHGLDTPLGEGRRGISAGQAQRVGLARAFLRAAPLLVLDEPTAHLDRASADGVAGAIADLARGRTTLLITHDRALAARAGRLVALGVGEPERAVAA